MAPRIDNRQKVLKKIHQYGSWPNLLLPLHFRLDLPLNDWEKREKDAIFIHGWALDDTMVFRHVRCAKQEGLRSGWRGCVWKLKVWSIRFSVRLPDCFSL
jgi:hypothetical protein